MVGIMASNPAIKRLHKILHVYEIILGTAKNPVQLGINKA